MYDDVGVLMQSSIRAGGLICHPLSDGSRLRNHAELHLGLCFGAEDLHGARAPLHVMGQLGEHAGLLSIARHHASPDFGHLYEDLHKAPPVSDSVHVHLPRAAAIIHTLLTITFL
jgi:hypothetical protein